MTNYRNIKEIGGNIYKEGITTDYPKKKLNYKTEGRINIGGVAKLLDSPSHFSKFDIFSRAAIKYVFKTYAKKKAFKKLQRLYLLKHINRSTKYLYGI